MIDENNIAVSETDEQIVKRVQLGDQYAFRIIVDRYTKKFERYARTFLFTKEQGEDLLQDIFLKTYIHLREYDLRRPFSPWIYRLAHNEFINAIRKNQRLPVFSVDWDAVFPHPLAKETSDNDFKIKELNGEIEGCLAELKVKYREPLILYYLDELNYQEISDILHVPVSTVGVRLARARSLFKKTCLKHGFTL